MLVRGATENPLWTVDIGSDERLGRHCALEAGCPVRVEHYLTLVGRALGIEYEDQYKKHTLLGNTDAILAETAPCAVANNIPIEEAREVVGRVFPARQGA